MYLRKVSSTRAAPIEKIDTFAKHGEKNDLRVRVTVAGARRRHRAVFYQFVCAATHVFLVDHLFLDLSLPQIRVHGFLHQIHDEEPAEEETHQRSTYIDSIVKKIKKIRILY